MLAKVYSAAVYGVDAYEVEIEVNAGSGDPVIVVVGLRDTAVKESKDRGITVITNSGYRWPRGRTTINLAPVDMRGQHAAKRALKVAVAGGHNLLMIGNNKPKKVCCNVRLVPQRRLRSEPLLKKDANRSE